MNIIHIIGNSSLYMNLLAQDLNIIGSDMEIKKFEAVSYPNKVEQPLHYAFIFYDKKSQSPLLVAERIRTQQPQCCIIFVHAVPDSALFAEFKKSNIFQISLPCTTEELKRIVYDAVMPQYFESHCQALDVFISNKLKQSLR